MRVRDIRILVVDDHDYVRSSTSMVMTSAGYQVTCAADGFDALLQMQRVVPDLVISDLNMPHMSGFEFLSVVRRRYPEVLVVASSGAYHDPGDGISDDVIADAFHAKGSGKPGELLSIVQRLLTDGVGAQTRKSAPIWIPCTFDSATDMQYAALTCEHCLRTFPVNMQPEGTHTRTAKCSFCLTEISFRIDTGAIPAMAANARAQSACG